MARYPEAKDFGHYTVDDTAGTLFSFAESGSPSSMPTGAKCFKGRVETAAIRIRLDGSAASATVGELISSGEDILLSETMLNQASLIRDTGTSGVIQGHFYNVEVDVFLGA